MKRPDPVWEANTFNAAVKVGQRVRYQSIKGEGPSIEYKTRTPAEVLSGHTAVVWLEGKSGCVACSHCTPVDPYEISLLSSDTVLTLVIEEHVDLAIAAERARAEYLNEFDTYPPFQHGYFCYGGENDEGEPDATWREPCKATDEGAEPVTYTQKGW